VAGFEEINPEKYVNFFSICQDQPNHFWIGKTDGLYEITFKINPSLRDIKKSIPTLPTVLLIEDHLELSEFVSECLQENYQVLCSYDGADGYNQAIQKVPDLIITDLMLPKMDGLSLARQIKGHELTSHIPLIMLTARSTEQERMLGLEGGADAYLTKPFSVEELMLTIKNLLHLRNKIAERFIQVWQQGADKALPVAAGSRTFFENFGVNEMLREIGMSRTQLHRKIKATTGQSANELLRSIKMQKALLLLRTTDHAVAEVASEVGFGSPSYFSKILNEHFGFLPSAVKENSESIK
jgi:DNA-binding response OmpR family regulator